MVNRGLYVAAILLACLSLGRVIAAEDATMNEVMARLKALEDKNRDLESKLKKAEATATRRSSVDAAVDRAMMTSEEKMGTVITNPDPHNRPLKIGGSLDISYEYNFNQPDTQFNNQRVFDIYHNSFNPNLAEVWFERLPEEPGQAGFRIDFSSGTDAPLFGSSSADGRDKDRLFDLQQAYIEYIAPVGNGITVDVGKFVTWSGYEVIESVDNINASRSILFGYAIPFAHTGIRATYPVFKDKWTVGLGVVNGWDNMTDQNMAKTAIFMSNWTPVSWFNWVVTGTVGDESFTDETAAFADATSPATLTNPDGGDFDGTFDDPTAPGAKSLAAGKLFDSRDSSPRFLIDTSMTFTPWENWTFVINADYGTEDTGRESGVNDPYHSWWGVAGYAKWQFSKKWYLALRGEVFDEDSGSRSGTSQTWAEGTLTLDYAITDPMHIRMEYRHDTSTDSVFGKSEGFDNDDDFTLGAPSRNTQDTVMVQFLYKF
jgi:hypothetical protein